MQLKNLQVTWYNLMTLLAVNIVTVDDKDNPFLELEFKDGFWKMELPIGLPKDEALNAMRQFFELAQTKGNPNSKHH